MSHLKKRLGQAGVDLSNPKLNESFVLIGTPLPPLEKTKDTNEFVPIWKQEVRDEKGRRRLHGAFTGGFSAGYFNTVGSKEGWAPSTFKSSRNDRQKGKEMRPEDFMDEEDRSEMQESRNLVDRDEAEDIRSKMFDDTNDTDSISAALSNMLPPVNESIGGQLLRKMGWKPGQGIGPRLTYEQLKRRCEQDGTPLPAVEDAEATKHTYAPRDTKMPTTTRKDDFHGLGYIPSGGLRSSKAAGEANGPKLSSGFGLGAVNDAEDDDIDVYDSGIAVANRRLAFEAGEDEDDVGERTNRPVVTAVTSQSTGFFKNGAPLLPGFVIVDIPVPKPESFEPPQVPENWNPDPNKVWNSKWDVQPKPTTTLDTGPTSDHQQWKKGVSSDERGAILGETPLPAATRSIWDYISAKDRERLQGLKDRPNATRGVPQSTPVHVVEFPRTDPVVAKAALQGFQPFKDNQVKQARYTEYLTAQASMQPVKLQPLAGQSIEAFNSELDSFSKAAQIFKPMSSAMASRFRSSTTIEAPTQQKEGLYQPTEETYAKHGDETEKNTKVEVEETPKEHAARLGMFGTMTREQKDWSPARLLCKRFKVPPPKVTAPDPAEDTDSLGQYTNNAPTEPLETMQVDSTSEEPTIRVVAAEGDGQKRNIDNIGLGEDDSQGQDTLTYERPSMDIFKAIFASDEESDDEPEDEPEPPTSLTPLRLDDATVPPPASQRIKAVAVNEPVDLSTFKPTFISRTDREKRKQVDGGGDVVKSSKKKNKSQGPVSFMEDDEVGLTVVPAAKKRKRLKDGDSKSGKKLKSAAAADVTQMTIDDEDDDSMWVEKEIPVTAPAPPSSTSVPPSKSETIVPGKSRPKASDFL